MNNKKRAFGRSVAWWLAVGGLTAGAGGCASVELDPLYAEDAGIDKDDDGLGGANNGVGPGTNGSTPVSTNNNNGPGPNNVGANNGDDGNNGAVDPNCPQAQTLWPDADGDGFGDAAAPSTTPCAGVLAGHVSNDGDCNDQNAMIHPDAAETPGDNVDGDCDGAELCFNDLDEDGFRETRAATVESIDADCDDAGEAKLTDPATDCQDNNPDVFPGGAEVCDGLDNNCDNVPDEGGICPCPAASFGGHAYLFCDTSRTWQGAQDNCPPGFLLTAVTTTEEDAFVYQQLASRGFADTWVGMHDQNQEGSWQWTTGEPWGYSHWDQGEPNNGGNGGEDCGVIMTTNGRQSEWDDRGCGSNRPYVCESLN